METVTEIKITCQGATTIPLDELVDLQGNLKDLSEDNYVKLRNSIVKYGFSFPIFVWIDPQDEKKYIVDAHQRLRVLRKMRDEENISIPPLPADIITADNRTQAKEKLLLLNSHYGKMTQEGFDEFISDLDIDEFGDLLALDDVMYLEEKLVEEDEAPAVDNENEPISKLGEVYQLGRHKLMCGDAKNIEHTQKLLDGKQPAMLFTDPPYGVDYVSRVDEERRKDWGAIQNDNLKDEELQQFLKDTIGIYGQTRYICCNWQSVVDFWKAFGRPNAFIIWDKGSIGLGAGYRNQHEIILFYGKLNHNSETNVWNIHRDETANYTHPTQKPVAIPARAIKNSSNEGDIVLDIFSGSGSTLIAAEQTSRTCYAMELDPKYCDVIRKRYAKFIDRENEWKEATPQL